MELEAKRLLYDIALKFKDGTYTTKTLSEMIVILRENKEQITDAEAKQLLEIPVNCLQNDVEIKNDEKWADENASYLGGNITWVDKDFQDKWRNRFYSGNYGLQDVIELTQIVKNNFAKYRRASEFLLRNAEVVLREDVVLKGNSKFKQHGEVFYNEITNIIK